MDLARHYFVTSTGTGVGKTYVTAALIRQARVKGLTVAATKPVISGFDKSEIATSDTGVLLAALGEARTLEGAEKISPWRFVAPLAPSMAARADGRSLDCQALFAHGRQFLLGKADLMLIEGVGGVMVPLDDKRTVLDWICALEAPVLLVVGAYLGTISHTLTAAEALRTRGARLAAVIVNEGEGAGALFDGACAEIVGWVAPVPVFGLRRNADGQVLTPLL